jgi:hypothetical protein
MPEAPLVVLAHRVVVTQQLVAAQHQLAEIHHALALALFFVQLVDLDLAAVSSSRASTMLGRRPSSLQPAMNHCSCLAGKRSSSTLCCFIRRLMARQLVLRIQDLETLGQVGQLAVGPQQPVAQAVEGADPHAAHIDRQHGRQPRHHFLGGLVGEGDGQQAAGRDLAGLQQPGDAGGQHPGLAGTGARQDQRMFIGQRDRGALLGIEIV